MTRVFNPVHQTTRYSSLGLLANPFLGIEIVEELGTNCETASECNLLLQAILQATHEDKPRPIWVEKDPALPNSYGLAAESRVEETVSSDQELNVLHAYIPLFGMKDGAVRSMINILGERLIWREFDHTLAAYIERVLAEPNETLTSFQVMGPEVLGAFSEAFAADPIGLVHAVLGEPIEERVDELNKIADMRLLDYVGDGAAETAADEGDEIDETVPDALGLDDAAEQRQEAAEVEPYAGVADYIVEYAGAHLSPVIGRALRVYRDRGLAAAARELNVTKAPRKTLLAVVQFARARFSRVLIIWDGFDSWLAIDPSLRSRIVGLLSETRWALDGDAVMVFLVGSGHAPELEESFGTGTKLSWAFPGLLAMEEAPGELVPEVVERWLARAALPGSPALTLASEGIRDLVEASGGSMERFIRLGLEAVEDAADRGAQSVDADAVSAAIAHVEQAEAEASALAGEPGVG